jgi:hypothetical protein
MNTESSCPKTLSLHTATCPLAEAVARPVETGRAAERLRRAARYRRGMVRHGDAPVNDKKKDAVPPTVHPRAPDRKLEQELKRNPDDDNLKADVGSDESMDASDPPSVTQPGSKDEPAPSSGFPE